jgi:hypothetical protein
MATRKPPEPHISSTRVDWIDTDVLKNQKKAIMHLYMLGGIYSDVGIDDT